MTSPTTSNRAAWFEGTEDDFAVRLSDVSVRYRVPTERVSTLKEQVIRRVRGQRDEFQEFWALRDLTLEIPRGQALGLVGRNGAGKSTLLKVIARVLTPTRGRVQINGIVAPLIELGTGFHPELTGRENIFLNGAMLGFSHEQMAQKVERIVEFSELAPFIDAPLRTYSSGMIMRLGFAIAVDVEPDILIVDEILAVGDLSFQKKGLARMREFKAGGTTILFVSHSPDSIRKLCDSAVWIDRGTVRQHGDVEHVIEEYTASVDNRPQLWAGAVLPEEQTRAMTSIFADMPADMAEGTHWMVRWVETAYREGIVAECRQQPLRYCPQHPLTAGELAIALLRARRWRAQQDADAGPAAGADTLAALPDDRQWSDAWFEPAAAAGLIPLTPHAASPFEPQKVVTRAELAVWLLRAKHGAAYTPPPDQDLFADVPAALDPADRWMTPWIEQIYREGITMGCSQQPPRYCPERVVTRAEAAVFLVRTFDIT